MPILCVGADGWEAKFPTGSATQYPSDVHQPPLPSGFPMTIKDLLLSGTPEPVSGRVAGVESGGREGHRVFVGVGFLSLAACSLLFL